VKTPQTAGQVVIDFLREKWEGPLFIWANEPESCNSEHGGDPQRFAAPGLVHEMGEAI
jgi:hypothetical protein